MKTSVPVNELLSLLADSQLDELEFASALEACKADDAALACWDTYHLIGDVLRAPTHAAGPGGAGAQLAFLSRLNVRLEQEAPVVGRPLLAEVTHAAAAHAAVDLSRRHEAAANDGVFRWKLVAGFASLLAVSAVAWNASGLLSPAPSPQLAQAPAAQIVVASPQGMMVRDVALDELLAAHRQFGAGSALQASSGFLQNAAFDAPQRASDANGR